MKITFTVLTYYPDKNGVQMVTQYMAEGLAKAGHEVTVVTSRKEYSRCKEIYNGVQIVRFTVKNKLKIDYGQKKEFQRFLLSKKNKMDVLITVCANTAFATWVYPIIDKISCRKIIYQHGMYDGHLHLNRIHSWERFIKQLLLTPYWELYHRRHWKQIMKYDACVHLFEGDSSHRYFEKHGFYNNHIIINTCEAVFFEDISESDLNINKKYGINRPYFLYVANYCSRKNQKLAIESFCAMKNNDSELVLVGSKENQYVTELRNLIKDMDFKYPDHGKIHLLVNISREEVILLTRQCYVCLMSSNNEYLPITIVESMACGHPFISTNVGVVSKLPGGMIAFESEDLTYWMDYCVSNFRFVNEMGCIAKKYARKNMYIKDKIEELEEICISKNVRK